MPCMVACTIFEAVSLPARMCNIFSGTDCDGITTFVVVSRAAACDGPCLNAVHLMATSGVTYFVGPIAMD